MKTSPWFCIRSQPPERTGFYEVRRYGGGVGVLYWDGKYFNGMTPWFKEWRGVVHE